MLVTGIGRCYGQNMNIVIIINFLMTLGSQQQTLAFKANAGEGRYEFSYPEYAVSPDGTVLSDPFPPDEFNVTCLLDGQQSDTITYEHAGGDGLFQVNSTTGELSLQDETGLDYEAQRTRVFSVGCTAPTAGLSSIAQVNFRVEPVNEFSPVVNPRSRFVIVNEDTPIGSVLVSTRRDAGAQVTFSVMDEDDGDDGEVVFTLAFSENLTSFAVDQSGTVTVAQALDADISPVGFALQRIRLTACDIKPPVNTCPNLFISLVIASVNDNIPTFEQSLYQVTVREDIPLGSLITDVSCTDADMGVGVFENITSSSSLFNVTLSPEQRVTLGGNLDFETAQIHEVILTCFDSEGNFSRATLQVTVQPVNDNSPRFTNPEYYFAMSRLLTTGNEVGRVVAIDLDQDIGGGLTYTITENENFQMQGDGFIILRDFVYVVEGQVFTFTVTASDGEFSDSASVVITVNGVLSIPEIILVCMGALVSLVFAVFIIVFCCYCCVCCSRL